MTFGTAQRAWAPVEGARDLPRMRGAGGPVHGVEGRPPDLPVLREAATLRARARGLLALARVEHLARVERAAHRGLQRERTGIQLTAHAVAFEDPDAVLAGHGAA